MSQEDLLREYQSLCDQIAYHNRKYYVEDAPEIDDFEYDRLYRRLETMEAEHPELVTPDSPTQKVGASALNTFAPVTHEVPMESLHDSFSEEELLDFDRRVREEVGDPVYVVEPKFDGLSVSLEYRDGLFVRGSTRGDGLVGEGRHGEPARDPHRAEKAQPPDSVSGGARRSLYAAQELL